MIGMEKLYVPHVVRCRRWAVTITVAQRFVIAMTVCFLGAEPNTPGAILVIQVIQSVSLNETKYKAFAWYRNDHG